MPTKGAMGLLLHSIKVALDSRIGKVNSHESDVSRTFEEGW